MNTAFNSVNPENNTTLSQPQIIQIIKLESAFLVNIDGNYIKNVYSYNLHTDSNGNAEVSLTLKIPARCADISIGMGESA